MDKTNAMRLLDAKKITYEAREYPPDITDGELVADMLGEPRGQVFKTLVTVTNKGEHAVFVVPVDRTLALKAAARAAGVKSVAMIKQKELEPLTGYVHGGCSPVGMKKRFRTFIDDSALGYDAIFCSAGRLGRQILVAPRDLAAFVGAEFAELTEGSAPVGRDS